MVNIYFLYLYTINIWQTDNHRHSETTLILSCHIKKETLPTLWKWTKQTGLRPSFGTNDRPLQIKTVIENCVGDNKIMTQQKVSRAVSKCHINSRCSNLIKYIYDHSAVATSHEDTDNFILKETIWLENMFQNCSMRLNHCVFSLSAWKN